MSNWNLSVHTALIFLECVPLLCAAAAEKELAQQELILPYRVKPIIAATCQDQSDLVRRETVENNQIELGEFLFCICC